MIPWASVGLLVRKKCGGLRFVLTRGDLMQSPCRDVFAIPRIDDLLDQLSRKKVPVSILDAKSGYWQIPMDPKSNGENSNYHTEGTL